MVREKKENKFSTVKKKSEYFCYHESGKIDICSINQRTSIYLPLFTTLHTSLIAYLVAE